MSTFLLALVHFAHLYSKLADPSERRHSSTEHDRHTSLPKETGTTASNYWRSGSTASQPTNMPRQFSKAYICDSLRVASPSHLFQRCPTSPSTHICNHRPRPSARARSPASRMTITTSGEATSRERSTAPCALGHVMSKGVRSLLHAGSPPSMCRHHLLLPATRKCSCCAIDRKHATKRHIETTHLKIKYVNCLTKCLFGRRFEWRLPFLDVGDAAFVTNGSLRKRR